MYKNSREFKSRQARHADAKSRQAGFTLVEMIVSIGLFAVVMVISVGALLALVSADRKAQALQSVMNNLNISLDSMVRAARTGTVFHCGFNGSISAPADCKTGDTYFAFEPYGGNHKNDQWVYQFIAAAPNNGCTNGGGCIMRSESGGAPSSWVQLTAPEVSITDMKFYVTGTTPGCDTNSPCTPIQPMVTIVVKGVAGTQNVKTTATFHIQATAVQRALDI